MMEDDSASEMMGANNTPAFLAGGGAMGQMMREKDWSVTPVGPIAQWPQSLRTAVSILLDSGFPMYIAWGSEFTQFYNDAYRPILGSTKHPAALGQSSRECFAEIWDFIGPMFQRVLDEGQNTTLNDQLLPLNRHGYVEECYFSFSYSAVRGESARAGGVFVTVMETTASVIGERRLRTLSELATHAGETRELESACREITRTLGKNQLDIPFALLYLLDDSRKARLCEATPVAPDLHVVPREFLLQGDGSAGWPFAQVYNSGRPSAPVALASLLGQAQSSAWPEPVEHALVLPLSGTRQGQLAGFMVTGISPRRELDDEYSTFLNLVAGQTSAAIANARAYEEERRRTEALAELDRAKTVFFSNVSHEFRTPLTLMLGPLEDAIGTSGLPDAVRDNLSLARRNTLRLLRLVNTLLDFSRIEAGRIRANFEPTNLSELTGDIASTFRSAIERAGMQLTVSTRGEPCVAQVDREMWEKIVVNLLSNAFKYTTQGQIAVTLSSVGDRVELRVADTGIGIPEEELPLIFNRFHRVENARGRSLEGTGIGLSLVAELVKLHEGTLTAESTVGRGTTFIATIPAGAPEVVVRSDPRALSSADSYEWVGDRDEMRAHTAGTGLNGRVLVADDNADMRDYVSRVLGSRFEISTAADGEEALEAIRANPPEVIVSDVMMPKLGGFGLLSAIRSDPRLELIPVILLSARAGEEARIEGVEAGADDYVIKPFSARELLARVTTHVQLSRLRRQAGATERALREQSEAERGRWQDLLLQAPAPIAVLRGPQHVFELANEPYARFVGRKPEQLLGKTVLEALPEIAGQEFLPLLDRVYSTGEAHSASDQPIDLNCEGTGTLSRRYVSFAYQPSRNAAGQVEGILVHAFDVTDTVLVRKRIEESESQLRTLAESIPQLVWTCKADGQCDYLSHQWERYTGMASSEQLGLNWLDRVLHPDDRERTYQAWMMAVQDRAPYDIEYRVRRHDGVYRWFKTRGTPLRNADGQIEKWFGTCTDIEDQKNAARAMVQKQKLEGIGLLAGGIAHDFNNLLVGVLGNAGLIGDTLAQDDPLQPLVKGVVDAGERAAHLTRQLLAYAGKGRFYVEVIDVAELVRTTYALIKMSLPKSVGVLLELAGDTPRIEADSGQVQQVIMNLVINGAEAIPEGRPGTVSIRTGTAKVDAKYLRTHRFVSTEPPLRGVYACVEIEDDGSGMDEATLGRIFDPFFTTKFTGRGLGLAAVQGIVSAARGAMEVTSSPETGTRFRVLLPVSEKSPDKHSEAARAVTKRQRTGTILVIDDETVVRETTRPALENNGYRVVLASSGEAGVTIYREQPGEIRLVLLDMSMPGMSGKETLRHIRSVNRNVPVLIFSGYSEDLVQDHFAGLNIAGFLQKPFTIHNLQALVDSVLSDSDH